MLNVEHLNFSYGSRKILDDVSFEIKDNDNVSMLGPNGTGNTTLLKCICNVLKPDSGTITIDDVDVSTLHGKELARTIGYVPQTVPMSGATVFDSVFMGRRPHMDWIVQRKDLELTAQALELLDLTHLSLRHLNEISGGEYQKVQMARVLLQEPKLMILDEPTNNLDIYNQHASLHTICNAISDRNMCTIMTMHDINLAVHYSNKFIFMKKGKVISAGGPEIITQDLIKEVYNMDADVIKHDGIPIVIPKAFPAVLNHYHHEHDGKQHCHRLLEVI